MSCRGREDFSRMLANPWVSLARDGDEWKGTYELSTGKCVRLTDDDTFEACRSGTAHILIFDPNEGLYEGNYVYSDAGTFGDLCRHVGRLGYGQIVRYIGRY